MTLPIEFEQRMKTLLGDEYGDFAAAYDQSPIRGLHVNLHKMTVDRLLDIADFELCPLATSRESFVFECDRIGAHPLHHSGAIYVQEPSAMLPAAMLDATDLCSLEDLRVLDLCASPGGKSSQAANLFEGRCGFLLSNEYVPKRALTLAENIERLGIADAAVTNLPSDVLARDCEGCFDLAIVDAPCSGEGMFRKNLNAVSEWSAENVIMCADKQRGILENAAKTVADGGYLLYSTCTFSIEENEANVDYFLKTHPEFVPVTPPENVFSASLDGIPYNGHDMSFCRRVYPHKNIGEGQFAALFHKDLPRSDHRSDGTFADLPTLSSGDEACAREFLLSVLDPDLVSKLCLWSKKDGVYIVSRSAILPKSGVLSPGVKLGEIRKGRLVPHHRFFMAFGRYFANKFEVDIDTARKYISGVEIGCDAFSGYGVVTYGGATLGGVKVSSGIAKNHYPKGLRDR